MFQRFIELAATKAQTDEQRQALQAILPLAAELDGQEQTFGARLDASRAARGEGPVKVGRKKQRELDGYARDAQEIEDAQLEEFSRLDAPWLIVYSLHAGLVSDLGLWSKPVPGVHPSDAVIIREFVAAKLELRDALAAWLARFPEPDDED